MQLQGRLADITSAPIERVTSLTLKAPAWRQSAGTEVTTTQPVNVPFSGDGTFTVDVVAGVGWLYVNGDGWSDSIRFVAADGMTRFVEAVFNAAPITVPGEMVRLSWQDIDGRKTGALDEIDAALESAIHNVVNTTETTYIAGWTNDTHANKVLRLNSLGKLAIQTDSITAASDPTNKAYVDRAVAKAVDAGNLAPPVGSGGWATYGGRFISEGNPATIQQVGANGQSQIYTRGSGKDGIPVTPGDYITVAYDITSPTSPVYTSVKFWDDTGQSKDFGSLTGNFRHDVTPNVRTRVYRTLEVPDGVAFAQARIGYGLNRPVGSKITFGDVVINVGSRVTAGGYADTATVLDAGKIIPQLSDQAPPVPSPAALRPWYDTLTQRFSRPINVYVVGDSISEGAGATSLHNRWVNRAQTHMRDLLGVPFGTEFPFIPARYALNTDLQPVLEGNWESAGLRGPGWRAVNLKDATAAITFTGVFYKAALSITTSGAASIEVTVDGGTPETLTVNASADSPLVELPTGTAVNTPRSLRVRLVSGSPVRVDGVYLWADDIRSGIRLIDASHSGFGYGTLGFDDAALVRNDVKRAEPDLIVSALMSNDITGNNPTRTSAIIDTYVKAYRDAAPGVPIVMLSMYKRAAHDEQRHEQFRQMVATKAAAHPGVFFLDLRRFMPDFVSPVEDPRNLCMSADGVHPTDLGHKRLAEVFTSVLADPAQIVI